MANTVLLKRSTVAGRAPVPADLVLGELAVNVTDGKLYLKKSASGVESIVDVTAGGMTNAELFAKVTAQDGSGSGLDADLLDGIQASAFAQLAATDPVWPDKSLGELLTIAFNNGRLIDSLDHPVIQRLLGRG